MLQRKATKYCFLSIAKQGFRLAAYGVKQGGIGSLLAGGIPVLRPGGAKRSPSQDSGSKPEMQSVNK